MRKLGQKIIKMRKTAKKLGKLRKHCINWAKSANRTKQLGKRRNLEKTCKIRKRSKQLSSKSCT